MKINPNLEPLLVPMTELKEDPDNLRKHNGKNLMAIEDSLRKFGQQKPIVCRKDGTIIAGNGLYVAANSLGWEKIAAVHTDLETLKDIQGYAIADNRTTDLSAFDVKELAATLDGMFEEDPDFTMALGFEEAELSNLFALSEKDKETGGAGSSSAPGDDPENIRLVELKYDLEQYHEFKTLSDRVGKKFEKIELEEILLEALRVADES